MSEAAVVTVAPRARQRTAEARRKSFLTAVANHAVAIALAVVLGGWVSSFGIPVSFKSQTV